MKERTKNILEAAVRDFIRAGRPITSEYLYDEYDFGIKPAMIRWELNDLAESGFFYQTRPSGGRLPTNKAYRFFVSELLADEDTDAPLLDAESLAHVFVRGRRKIFMEGFSGFLKVLGVCYETPSDNVYESGLNELLENLEVESKNEIMGVIRDFELLPKRLADREAWWRHENVWPQVFIGANPFTRSDHVSVVASRFEDSGGEFLLVAVGPKRMDYRKSLSTFKTLKKSVEKSNHDHGRKHTTAIGS